MPTNANAYNSRVTDEALEKRFRDTFKSQGGSELVDDLYAQGVIVPIVDFTAAATGGQLGTNLQTAWDFSTGSKAYTSSTADPVLINNAGFWQIWGNLAYDASQQVEIVINDGTSSKTIQKIESSGTVPDSLIWIPPFVVYLRSNDSVQADNNSSSARLFLAYRQIATVSGDLVNPTGFTSS